MSNIIETEWHTDNHTMSVYLDADSITVISTCPTAGKTGDCHTEGIGCIVTYFLDIYGLDCNVGQALAHPDMKIAWSVVGDPRDMDLCQVWVIPEEDAAFQGWFTHVTGSTGDEDGNEEAIGRNALEAGSRVDDSPTE